MNQSIFEIQAEFCKAMGNSVRLQILHILRDRPKTAGEICQELGLPHSNVSHHLASLRSVGVVTSTRHGIEMIYQIADKRIVEVCDLVRSVLVEQIRLRSRSIE